MRILLIIWLITSSVLLNAENSPRGRLEHILTNLKTMQANFKQRVSSKRRLLSSSRGTMALSRPGKFRWETTAPMPQIIIADGQKLWIYDVDLEQVTIKKQQKSISGTTAALFLSDGAIIEGYKVSTKKIAKKEIFYLKPQNSEHQEIVMTFLAEKLTNLDFSDKLGQITKIKFSNAKINKPLATKLFIFLMPKDVDVIEQ